MAKLKKLTQRKLADNFVKQMEAHLENALLGEEAKILENGIRRLNKRLDEVLRDAGNDEMSDGSIDTAHIRKLREVRATATNFMYAIERWRMSS